MGYYINMRDQKFFVPAEHAATVINMTRDDRDEFAFDYEFTFDDENNIDGIEFVGEKLLEEYKVFKKIAPYVKDGSFIEMAGEDSAIWRWVFHNGTCDEVAPKISWEQDAPVGKSYYILYYYPKYGKGWERVSGTADMELRIEELKSIGISEEDIVVLDDANKIN